jgi:hypothetical protein
MRVDVNVMPPMLPQPDTTATATATATPEASNDKAVQDLVVEVSEPNCQPIPVNPTQEVVLQIYEQ